MTEAGFEECFREHFPRLVALGETMTGDSAVAHELAQESFVRLHARWETVSSYERPEGWLRRVMSNLLIDHHRSRVAERRAVERLATRSRQDDDPDAFEPDAWSYLLAALPSRQRLVVTLFYGFDQSISEVADAMGVSQNTVKSSLSKARETLRAGLEQDNVE
jgi:RNA polymerase sigma factor (sigma-70 family)